MWTKVIEFPQNTLSFQCGPRTYRQEQITCYCVLAVITLSRKCHISIRHRQWVIIAIVENARCKIYRRSRRQIFIIIISRRLISQSQPTNWLHKRRKEHAREKIVLGAERLQPIPCIRSFGIGLNKSHTPSYLSSQLSPRRFVIVNFIGIHSNWA